MTQTININSPQGQEILRRQGLTQKPCPKPEHRNLGYTRHYCQPDEKNNPQSCFTNNQVLFFACAGCHQEKIES